MAASDVLGSDLLGVVARLNRLASQQARLGMPVAQARLLAQIEERGRSRICQLAAADHCSQPTMTTQVRRLEAGGWAVREQDPADARAVLVSVTPAGRSALSAARSLRAAAIAPYLDRLAPAERARLTEAVSILHRMLGDASTAASSQE